MTLSQNLSDIFFPKAGEGSWAKFLLSATLFSCLGFALLCTIHLLPSQFLIMPILFWAGCLGGTISQAFCKKMHFLAPVYCLILGLGGLALYLLYTAL
ncbi:MAG: hypothetical protein CMF60_02790 [Magnetococcales bacterium]|nr:hypothetical protein [Magnetococcales bacterium]|tara:strand:+ start:769 stop:1062 length:294 start_codon:yes stop_codon:yes gene_type:complete